MGARASPPGLGTGREGDVRHKESIWEAKARWEREQQLYSDALRKARENQRGPDYEMKAFWAGFTAVMMFTLTPFLLIFIAWLLR